MTKLKSSYFSTQWNKQSLELNVDVLKILLNLCISIVLLLVVLICICRMSVILFCLQDHNYTCGQGPIGMKCVVNMNHPPIEIKF